MRPSFRARILLVVFIAAVVPLGVLGIWLTRATARSGEELLRARLTASLDRVVPVVGAHWVDARSRLLDLVERADVRNALAAEPAAMTGAPAGVVDHFSRLDPLLERAVLRDSRDSVRWIVARKPTAVPRVTGSPPLVTRFAVHEPARGTAVGTLELDLSTQALFGNAVTGAVGPGEIVAMFDRATGASLHPLPFDAAGLDAPEFTWAGDRWISVRRSLVEPTIDLVVAAPLGPFTEPFARTAGRGLTGLAVVALLAMVVATVLTGRLTRSLRALTVGADAVARGELDRQVPVSGSDEIAHVATSFNAMTRQLRRTLSDLSAREGLAAVGTFATELAHEIRNPLTAVRLDLQMVEERLPEGSDEREIQRQALEEIARLDRIVGGALHVARSGRIRHHDVALDAVLAAAVRVAEPIFAARHARLVAADDAGAGVRVHGDADALQQVFVNILVNAAEAVAVGGVAALTVTATPDVVTVSVRDDGPGMTPDVIARARDPFFTTRSDGTGLGLAIVARIVAAHGGEIGIESGQDRGTCVSVSLPMEAVSPPNLHRSVTTLPGGVTPANE
jgi:signal transduction histidine kinase